MANRVAVDRESKQLWVGKPENVDHFDYPKKLDHSVEGKSEGNLTI